jgi:hypothetical protein
VVVPLLLGIIVILKQKIEFYRYLSIIVPYTIIFVVYALSKIKYNFVIVILIFILMIINIYGLSIHYRFDFKNDDYRPIIKHIEIENEAGDRLYVEPHYMGWSIDYYKKQWNLNMPNPAFVRYGWNEVMDSIKTQKPERFWLVLDYSALDTTKYTEYINGLQKDFKLEEKNTYNLAPERVELYRFRK